MIYAVSIIAGMLLGIGNNYFRNRFIKYALSKPRISAIMLIVGSSIARLALIAAIAVFMIKIDSLSFILFFLGLFVVTFIGSKIMKKEVNS
jgi:hypothetical protein